MWEAFDDDQEVGKMGEWKASKYPPRLAAAAAFLAMGKASPFLLCVHACMHALHRFSVVSF